MINTSNMCMVVVVVVVVWGVGSHSGTSVAGCLRMEADSSQGLGQDNSSMVQRRRQCCIYYVVCQAEQHVWLGNTFSTSAEVWYQSDQAAHLCVPCMPLEGLILPTRVWQTTPGIVIYPTCIMTFLIATVSSVNQFRWLPSPTARLSRAAEVIDSNV